MTTDNLNHMWGGAKNCVFCCRDESIEHVYMCDVFSLWNSAYCAFKFANLSGSMEKVGTCVMCFQGV